MPSSGLRPEDSRGRLSLHERFAGRAFFPSSTLSLRLWSLLFKLEGFCCVRWSWPTLRRRRSCFPIGRLFATSRNPCPGRIRPTGALTYYRDVALPAMERGEQWNWTLRLKSNPEQLIGSISLIKGDRLNRGFWLGLPWHGQGLMTEACEAVTEYWFNTLKFTVLRAPKAVGNVASRRISEKSGMRLVATEEHEFVSGLLPAEGWEITAEEWNGRRKP
jgi:[ribosomal protein S5]-alanine N-acetyltransferase